jgi:triphosphatase
MALASSDMFETEIKLVMDAAALRQLPKLPVIADHSLYNPVTRRLRSNYFDTDDLALREQGITVRLRRDGRRSLQTVKLAGTSSGGLHQRREWETHTPLDTLDFSTVNDPELRDLFDRADLRRALRPVFETDFRRTQRMLRFGDDEIKFSIDRGEVRAAKGSEPICEVELELKAGDVARLFEVARALNNALPLRLEARSKAERGYRLFTGEPGAPRKAIAPRLERDMTVSDAFVNIAQSCVAHLQANELGVLHSEDIEYLHQMRVALRRLRSAFSLFAGVIPKQASAAIVDQLRWLARELNDARNWDVFVAETLPPILQARADDAGLAGLHQQSLQAQRSVRQGARAAVAAPRYQAMLLDLGHWLATRAWQAPTAPQVLAPQGHAAETLATRQQTLGAAQAPAAEQPLLDFASALLTQRHERLRKRGKHLAQQSAEERHSVRIAAKKLRYAAEFFGKLYAKREVQAYVRALAQVQDVLGMLNDAATTSGLLDALPKTTDNPVQDRALGLIQGWVEAGGSNAVNISIVTWDEYKKTARFW